MCWSLLVESMNANPKDTERQMELASDSTVQRTDPGTFLLLIAIEITKRMNISHL